MKPTDNSIKHPSLWEGLGGLTLNEYQQQAMTTCMQSSNNFSYMFLNLVGEVGEFASKVAKAIRKGEARIGDDNNSDFTYIAGDEADEVIIQKASAFEAELAKEAGDILWQLFGLMSVMGWDAEDIARQNLEKLASRQKRNVIDGNGDNR